MEEGKDGRTEEGIEGRDGERGGRWGGRVTMNSKIKTTKTVIVKIYSEHAAN